MLVSGNTYAGYDKVLGQGLSLETLHENNFQAVIRDVYPVTRKLVEEHCHAVSNGGQELNTLLDQVAREGNVCEGYIDRYIREGQFSSSGCGSPLQRRREEVFKLMCCCLIVLVSNTEAEGVVSCQNRIKTKTHSLLSIEQLDRLIRLSYARIPMPEFGFPAARELYLQALVDVEAQPVFHHKLEAVSKMGSLGVIKHLVRPGDFIANGRVPGQFYQFQCLPFGTRGASRSKPEHCSKFIIDRDTDQPRIIYKNYSTMENNDWDYNNPSQDTIRVVTDDQVLNEDETSICDDVDDLIAQIEQAHNTNVREYKDDTRKIVKFISAPGQLVHCPFNPAHVVKCCKVEDHFRKCSKIRSWRGVSQVLMLLYLWRLICNRGRRRNQRAVIERRQRQRRLLYLCLAVAQVMHAATIVDRAIWEWNRSKNWWAETVVGTFTDADWQENFRVSRLTFDYLCDKLRARLQRRRKMKWRIPVPVEKRVAVALWYLATGCGYRTLRHLFGVAKSTVCEFVHEKYDVEVDMSEFESLYENVTEDDLIDPRVEKMPVALKEYLDQHLQDENYDNDNGRIKDETSAGPCLRYNNDDCQSSTNSCQVGSQLLLKRENDNQQIKWLWLLSGIHPDTMNVGYADDVTLSRTLLALKADDDRSVEEETSNLDSWASERRMTLNGGKSQLLQICFCRSVPEPPTLTLGGAPVPVVSSAKGLGFILDQGLTFNEQVNAMVTKASRRLHHLRLLTKQGMSVSDLIQVYLALVRPVLEYGHVLLVGCSKQQDQAIEKVQRRALRIISLGGRRSVPVLPTLRERRELAAVKLLKNMLNPEHPLHDLVPDVRPAGTGMSLRNSGGIRNRTGKNNKGGPDRDVGLDLINEFLNNDSKVATATNHASRTLSTILSPLRSEAIYKAN
ncbi:hypothetical protein Bbelb_049030 [Branchiostoma belcheri]|nr:hypothetical protein Bbelb_049030 [Branchiostoma belcheri]